MADDAEEAAVRLQLSEAFGIAPPQTSSKAPARSHQRSERPPSLFINTQLYSVSWLSTELSVSSKIPKKVPTYCSGAGAGS